MMTLLLGLWFLTAGELPGPAEPVWAVSLGSEKFAMVRQETGGFPELWLVSEKQQKKLSLPGDCLFVSAGPSHDSLFLVTATSVLEAVPAEDLKVRKKWCDFQEPLSAVRSWVAAPLLQEGEHFYLLVQDAGSASLLNFQTGKISRHPVDEKQRSERGIISFLFPRAVVFDGAVFWMNEGRLYSLNLKKPETLNREEAPKGAGLEKAVAIPAVQGSNHWFFFGGKQGDRDSLGWRLVDGNGKTVHRDKGIVIKFADQVSAAGDQRRFWVITVPAKFSSQIWKFFSGNTSFKLTAFELRDQNWKETTRMTIKLSREKGDDAPDFGFDRAADWNGDGFSEVLAYDGKRGLRMYQTQSSGFSEEPVSLGETPHRVIALENVLLFFNKKHQGWHYKVVKP